MLLGRMPKQRLRDTYDRKEVRIAVETNYPQRIEPLPHFMGFLSTRQAPQFFRTLVMNRFRLKEEYEQCRRTGQCRL